MEFDYDPPGERAAWELSKFGPRTFTFLQRFYEFQPPKQSGIVLGVTQSFITCCVASVALIYWGQLYDFHNAFNSKSLFTMLP